MLTFNGTDILMYQNSSLITTVNFPGDIRTDVTTPLMIGGAWAPGEFFTGRISTTHLYNRALSAAEVAQNFEALRGRYGV
jgi:K+-transporting ATPase c subunit